MSEWQGIKVAASEPKMRREIVPSLLELPQGDAGVFVWGTRIIDCRYTCLKSRQASGDRGSGSSALLTRAGGKQQQSKGKRITVPPEPIQIS